MPPWQFLATCDPNHRLIATAGDAAQDAADCTPSNSDCAQNAPWRRRRMHARSAFLHSSLTASAADGAALSKPTLSLSRLPKFGVVLAANTIPVPSRQTSCQIDVVCSSLTPQKRWQMRRSDSPNPTSIIANFDNLFPCPSLQWASNNFPGQGIGKRATVGTRSFHFMSDCLAPKHRLDMETSYPFIDISCKEC